jgi:hypothetical protein
LIEDSEFCSKQQLPQDAVAQMYVTALLRRLLENCMGHDDVEGGLEATRLLVR